MYPQTILLTARNCSNSKIKYIVSLYVCQMKGENYETNYIWTVWRIYSLPIIYI